MCWNLGIPELLLKVMDRDSGLGETLAGVGLDSALVVLVIVPTLLLGALSLLFALVFCSDSLWSLFSLTFSWSRSTSLPVVVSDCGEGSC